MSLFGIDFTQAQIIAALVNGTIAILLALWTFFTGRSNQKAANGNQKEIEGLKNTYLQENERLKSNLAELKSENDARRAYEFDARKRLYQEYEPLLFQLMEASENAFQRIRSIARTAKNGDLGEKSWLDHFGYYSRSTIYNLLVPMAIYQIMKRKLTLVDLNVDKSVGLLYKLIKQVYIIFKDDYRLAASKPTLVYKGDSSESAARKQTERAVYSKQGLPMGLLDKTIEFLIEETNGKERVISYGEFEKKLEDVSSDARGNTAPPDSSMDPIKEMFSSFHPDTCPVLWRMLMAQSILYHTLLELRKDDIRKIDETIVKSKITAHPSAFINDFNWEPGTHPPSDKVKDAYHAAIEYLNEKF